MVEVGDTVRLVKQKKIGDKDLMDKFKAGKHKVESNSENVGQKCFMLSDTVH